MSYINDTQMSKIRFCVHTSTLCSDDGSSYNACVSVEVNEPEYIPEYFVISGFIKSYEGVPCRPDYLVSSLFDLVDDQVKSCSHLVVTFKINIDNFENVFVREQDFKLKKVM